MTDTALTLPTGQEQAVIRLVLDGLGSGSAGVSGDTGPARPHGCKKVKRVGDYRARTAMPHNQ
jgi:hypothetical protein